MTSETLIIDSGGANLASLEYALERLGAHTRITSSAHDLASAERVILPGVGSAGDAMQRLQASGLAGILPSLSCPVLGICLGMQLLYEHSAEGDVECLGIIPGQVVRLHAERGRPVPHMGWNQLEDLRADPLLEGVAPKAHVYFVHSFAATVSVGTLATTVYGSALSAVVRRRNFWGTQFHPERSAAAGARILHNFLRIS